MRTIMEIIQAGRVKVEEHITNYTYEFVIDSNNNGDVYSVYVTGGMLSTKRVYFGEPMVHGYDYDDRDEKFLANEEAIDQLAVAMIQGKPINVPVGKEDFDIRNYIVSAVTDKKQELNSEASEQ